MAVVPGQGTTLTVAGSIIAQVIDIDGPSMECDTHEITVLSDTFKQWRAGLPDGGEVNFTLRFDPSDASHTQLNTLVSTYPQQVSACAIGFISGNSATFNAYVTKYNLKGANEDDDLMVDTTLKVSGKVTFA